MRENDRSATGFLVPDEFQAVADQFFSQPDISVRGWERAVDAQARIVREVEHVLGRDEQGDVLFIGHGGVGTLLYCYYSGVAIDRSYDQPAAAASSHSRGRAVACSIHGVPSKTSDCRGRAIALGVATGLARDAV